MTCIDRFSNVIPQSFVYTQILLQFSSEIYADESKDWADTAAKVLMLAGAFFLVVPAILVDLIRGGLKACGFHKAADLCLIDEISEPPNRTVSLTQRVRRNREVPVESIERSPQDEVADWKAEFVTDGAEWMDENFPAQTVSFLYESLKTVWEHLPAADQKVYIGSLVAEKPASMHYAANTFVLFSTIYSRKMTREFQDTLIDSYKTLRLNQKIQLFSKVTFKEEEGAARLDMETDRLWLMIKREGDNILANSDFPNALKRAVSLLFESAIQ